MDGWTAGADVGTMLTGLSALTATFVWTRTQWRTWRAERAQIKLRNWHAFVAPERINEWHVRLAEEPRTPTGRVVLEVLDSPDGAPDAGLAHSMRQIISADRMLSRAPTPEEYDFLKAQRRARHQTGFPVGSDQADAGLRPLMRHLRRPLIRR